MTEINIFYSPAVEFCKSNHYMLSGHPPVHIYVWTGHDLHAYVPLYIQIVVSTFIQESYQS